LLKLLLIDSTIFLIFNFNCFTLVNAFGLAWMTEGNEQKKKRMKGDPDIPRLSPSMRNQQEFFASLKGEQVWIDFMKVNYSFPIVIISFNKSK